MSTFEDRARAVKVARILAHVPCGATREELGVIADWLASFSPEQRARFAKVAGAKAPSDTTWTAVVDGARARITPADALRRAGGSR